MMIASKGAVWTAAVILVASAVTGGYLGYSRAASAPGGSADADAYDVTPLAAKQATAVNAAAPPPIDEDYIRKIAHDEAETVLHPPQAAKKVAVASASDDSSDDSGDDKAPGANPPTPPPVAPAAVPAAAAAAKPPPPPPTGLY
jgi:hypothetical protein